MVLTGVFLRTIVSSRFGIRRLDISESCYERAWSTNGERDKMMVYIFCRFPSFMLKLWEKLRSSLCACRAAEGTTQEVFVARTTVLTNCTLSLSLSLSLRKKKMMKRISNDTLTYIERDGYDLCYRRVCIWWMVWAEEGCQMSRR